jgi:hypothetical protein
MAKVVLLALWAMRLLGRREKEAPQSWQITTGAAELTSMLGAD